jgi:hypothetical protein
LRCNSDFWFTLSLFLHSLLFIGQFVCFLFLFLSLSLQFSIWLNFFGSTVTSSSTFTTTTKCAIEFAFLWNNFQHFTATATTSSYSIKSKRYNKRNTTNYDFTRLRKSKKTNSNTIKYCTKTPTKFQYCHSQWFAIFRERGFVILMIQ